MSDKAVVEWRLANPDKIRDINARSYLKNKDKYAKAAKARYDANPEFYRERAKKARLKGYSKYLVTRLRRRALELGLSFDLTPEDIHIPEVCPVLGIAIVLEGEGQRDDSPSVDRLDPKKGYTKDNIQIVSMKANRIKNDATIEELEKVLSYMRSRSCP